MKLFSFIVFLLVIVSINLARLGDKPSGDKKDAVKKPVKAKAKAPAANKKPVAKKTPKPRTFALKSYTVSFEFEGKEAGTGVFQIENLTNPQKNHLVGWHFKFDKQPSKQLEGLLVKDGDSLYIPYRLFSSDVTYVNPFGSAKYLQFYLASEKHEIHKIVVKLPFANNKTFINDEESSALKGLLNSLIVQARVRLNDFKKSASVQAGNYINVKPFFTAASKGDKALQEAVAVANHESDALALMLKSDTENFDVVKKELDKIEKRFFELKNRLSYFNDRISESKNLRIAKMTWVKNLHQKKAKDVKTNLNNEENKTKDAFEVAIASMSAELPGETTDLENARKTIVEKLDLGTYVKMAGKFFAGN